MNTAVLRHTGKALAAVISFGIIFSTSMTMAQEAALKNIQWGGDFRLRHEMIDKDDLDSSNHRQRIRARLNAQGTVNDQLKVVMQVTSGAQEATSTNQTLDGGYSNKPFDIDMAYAEWQASAGSKVLAGKVKNTFFTPGDSEMIFDGDVTFEGVSVNSAGCGCGSTSYFTNYGVYWYEERDNEAGQGSDTFQYSAQVGLKTLVKDHRLTAGLGYHAFAPMKDNAATAAKGNSTVGGAYATDFEIIQAFVEAEVCKKGRGTDLYVEYVSNAGADNENQGYTVGLVHGKLKAKRDWSVGYFFRNVEQDAVLGAISDGDFGDGETNSRGHKVQFKYQVADSVAGMASYFKNERDVTGAPTKDYDRAQLDLVLKF